ncbi:MAG TPA: acyl-CoA desaturase [Ktedonobacteraceae bacterium]|jgi:stearoyl-CoA desaturase (delta-9 desaturase)
MQVHPLFKLVILLLVVIPLLGTVAAIVLLWNHGVSLLDVELLVGMYVFIGFGCTVGYHRMLTHRSFVPHPVVKVILLVLGSMAFEGAPITWAATHIRHHALSDRQGDPHSPLEGFFHAHVWWLLKNRMADPRVYCRYLLDDPLVLFIDRTFLLWSVCALAFPCVIDGWHGLLWGGLVRMFLTHHVTWSVNSICHTFGRREYQTSDQSRNQWVVGILALGEGWHNNHHAFPRSAFHGLHWWQIDLSGYLIWGLERLGLARQVARVSPALRDRQRLEPVAS